MDTKIEYAHLTEAPEIKVKILSIQLATHQEYLQQSLAQQL